RLRAFVAYAAARVQAALRRLTRPFPLITGLAEPVLRTRSELVAENALLRQQLIVVSRKVHRPAFRSHERGLLVLLARLVPLWRDALLLVKPDTLLRWHRAAFRLFWKQRSRSAKRCEPRISQETTELVRQMARDNRVRGAERIRGELLKLGFRVAKRTIQRHIRAVRPPSDGRQWRDFLKNHTVWSCDFLQVYDVWFRPIFAFFIVDVNTKEVVHVAVTRQPSERWTAQQ